MPKRPAWWPALLAVALACSAPSGGGQEQARVPVVGGPCEGCEAVFQAMPAQIGPVARIAPPGTPGEPLRITGVVRRMDGRPAPGAVVYAYHTDVHGAYPRDERLRGTPAYRHGRLRGWVRADAQGRYRFDTVRPGGYPGSSIPQHIHMHVIEPGRCTYYIDDIVFRDDPRLTPERLRRYVHGRGGSGVTTPRRDPDGVWVVERDVVLGQGIPDYDRCEARSPRNAAEPS